MVDRRRSVYVGSGSWSGETGKIQVFSLDVEALSLSSVQLLDAGGVAAFMARSSDGRRLYVADETKGLLSSYAIDPATGALELTSSVSCAGHPVYVALDGTGSALLTCFFEEAKTQVFRIAADGTLGASACLVESGRESHCTLFDPSHRFLFVPTRGDNWIAQYRYDAAQQSLTPNEPAHVAEAPGAGPRHLAFHPNGRWAFLVNELSLTLSVYAFDPERGTLRPTLRDVSVVPPGSVSPGGGGASAADIHVHPSGRFLYVSNRQGDQSNIAIVSVDAQSGAVSVIGHEPTRGRTPRNFALDADGRILIAGNQDSSDIALFQVDASSGRLTFVRSVPVAPGPFFIGIY
jgi:6-phosphogluconolactonase